MKLSLLLFALGLSVAIYSQDCDLVNRAKSIVAATDTITDTTRIFRGIGFNSYAYHLYNGRIVKITHGSKHGPKQIAREYYLQDTSLAYATESAVCYYLCSDAPCWTIRYYFDNGNLVHYEITGDIELRSEFWDIKEEILKDYHDTKKRVEANRAIKFEKLYTQQCNFD